MIKPIAIILGEPNSISSEIIFKSWIKKKKFKHLPCLIIGNYNSTEYLDVRATELKIDKLIEINSGSINWINEKNNNFIPLINYETKKKLKKNNNINLHKNEQFYVKSIDQIPLSPWYFTLILSILLLFISWYKEAK